MQKEEDKVQQIEDNKQKKNVPEGWTRKKKKKIGEDEEYECGEGDCKKIYHTYAGFYNHCKKAHEGKFPEGSLVNNRPFVGPSKNRGRPRKVQTNVSNDNDRLYKATKCEADLLEFLTSLKFSEKNILESVDNPENQLSKAIQIVKGQAIADDSGFLADLDRINKHVCSCDLPLSADPSAKKEVNSYNLGSVLKFMRNKEQYGFKEFTRENLRLLLLIWLTRIISVEALAEVIAVVLLENLGEPSRNDDKLTPAKAKQLIEKIDKLAKSSVKSIVLETTGSQN